VCRWCLTTCRERAALIFGGRLFQRKADDFVIVVRVEVACGIWVSCRCKVLVKGDINKVVFDFV
jgi:hypothetical protein